MRGRSFILLWIFVVASVLLVTRLYTVQIRQGAGLAAKASEERQATYSLDPRRGDIVDRFGAVFATTLPSYYVSVRPPEMQDPHAVAAKLAPLLGAHAQDIERAMGAKEPYVYLARNEPKAAALKVRALALPAIEVGIEPMGRRVAPQAQVGSTVVGFTGVDDQGLAGVEYQFNDERHGGDRRSRPSDTIRQKNDSSSHTRRHGRLDA
jgi:cell division protein FtsI/penicillin-binding protein 2